MQELTADDVRLLADPHWRDRLFRACQAAATSAIGSDPRLEAACFAWDRLARRVPHGNGGDALSALRRLRRIMNAFAMLSHVERQALAGRLPPLEIQHLTGDQAVALRVERQAAVWLTDPDLADYKAEIDAELARAGEAGRQQAEAKRAAEQATVLRLAAAPGIVSGWHDRGIRLDVSAAGRPRAFPASSLTAEDRGLLTSHGAELAQVIRAEWFEP